MAVQFYPPLSSILSLQDLPEVFDFLREPLTNIFNKVYFKDLQTSKGPKGDSAFYSLTLISYKRIQIEIPGTGIYLLLNPPMHDSSPGVTEIPVQLHYEWKVLRFARAFNLESFPYDPVSFFGLVTELLDVPEYKIVEAAIDSFAGVGNVDGFVDDANAALGLSLAYPAAGAVSARVQVVMQALQAATGFPAVALLFPIYLHDAGSTSETFARLGTLFTSFLGGQSVEAFILNLLLPKIEASLGVGVGLEFPRSILMPLDETPGDTYGLPLAEPAKTVMTFDVGDFQFSTEKGVGFSEELTANLPFCGIGNTGLTVEIDTAKLDISRTTNIPEATADGRPNDFVGVYIKEARIGLPQFWKKDNINSTASLFGRNLIIGTGGLSGTLGMEANVLGAPSPLLVTNLGSTTGFSIGLNAFSLTFKQNSIVGSSIKGFLTIPGFEDKANPGQLAKIAVDVTIGDNAFEVTASVAQGVTLKFGNVFEIKIFSLTIGKKSGKFYIAVSGELTLTATVPGSADPLLPAKVEIKKLLIYEDGSFEFEGGVSIQTDVLKMKLGPVELTITAIHLGTHQQFLGATERKYAYFGFDGGVSLDPVGVDARGEGIKFYFTTDVGAGKPFHSFVRIDGIGIDLIIPGDATAEAAALLLSGYLSMKSPENAAPGGASETEYMGSVTFSLPKIGLSGSASMRLAPKIPAFVVDIGLELPAPILLGTTGLGIYGFRGLVGNAYVPSKSAAGVAEADPWWKYYKAKVAPANREGIQVEKFQQKDGFSVGAGISLATAPDAGRSFSSKIFFLLGLPDVFLLQGQGAVLAERVGLDTSQDPPFFALIAITSTSVEAAFGVNYNVPSGGEILALKGTLEMGFFFGNASAWYINVGRDQPDNMRVEARILNLFNGYAFLMLSNSGIKAGAGVSWEFSKKYGPVKVELGAYLDIGGKISFKPVQVGGFVSLGGYARLRVFGFKFGFEVSASLAAEAPQPFIVSGKFTLKINLPWPFDDIKVSVELTWTFNNQMNLNEEFLLDISNMDSKAPISAVNMLTKETFPVNYLPRRTAATIPAPTNAAWVGSFDTVYVPLDSRIDLEFVKAVKPGGTRLTFETQGYTYHEMIPPQKGKSEQVKHEYIVEEVNIKAWNPVSSAWEAFDVWLANTPLQTVGAVTLAELATKAFGYWQYGDLPNRYTKLSLLSLTPFTYITGGSPNAVVPEQLGYPEGFLTCEGERLLHVCQNWESPNHTVDIPGGTLFQDRLLLYRHTGIDPLILPALNPFGLKYGVVIGQGEKMVLTFHSAQAEVRLSLSTTASCVSIVAYTRKFTIDSKSRKSRAGTFSEVEVYNKTVSAATLANMIAIQDLSIGIHRIEISPCVCDKSQPTKNAETMHYQWALAEYPRAKKACDQWTAFINRLSQCCVQNKGNVAPGTTCYQELLTLSAELDIVLGKNACSQSAEASTKGAQACAKANELAAVIAYYERRPGQTLPQPTNPFACATFLHQVCWLTLEQYNFNVTIPSQAQVDAANDAMADGISKTIQPIWRPSTKYVVQIKTKDKLTVSGNVEREYTQYYNFGFQTAGGLGHFHHYVNSGGSRVYRSDYQDLLNKDREQEYRLALLQHYIHLERSYPDAKGALIGAKPLYYEVPTISLYFVQEYVYAMFNNWAAYLGNAALTASLALLIKDPAEGPSGAGSEDTGLVWTEHPLANMSSDMVVLNNIIINGANCSGLVGPLEPRGMNVQAQPDFLLPSKLYQAVFTAKMGAQSSEVHRYNFQTSRYPTFAAHVGSYLLDATPGHEVTAVFRIDLNLSAADLSLVNAVLNDTATAAHEAIRGTYADRLERLLTGAMKIPAMHPAVTTEFNIIRNAATGAILGVLIRTPEPINDPKMPLANQANGVLAVHTSSSGPSPVLSVKLFSRDITSVFVSDATRNIPVGNVTFTFQYLLWNGSAYTPTSVSIISIPLA
jgi:hypothetical protein